MPREGVERRWGFRVVIADLPETLQEQTKVEVDHDGQTSTATLLDLSLTGMLIDLHADIGVAVGNHTTVTIECGARSVTLDGAIVRSLERGVLGIHFPETIKEGEFDPPTRLATLHRRLERAWLKARSDAEYESDDE